MMILRQTLLVMIMRIVDDSCCHYIDELKKKNDALQLGNKYDYILIDRLNYLTTPKTVLDNGFVWSPLTMEMILNRLKEYAEEWHTKIALLYRKDKYDEVVLGVNKNI